MLIVPLLLGVHIVFGIVMIASVLASAIRTQTDESGMLRFDRVLGRKSYSVDDVAVVSYSRGGHDTDQMPFLHLQLGKRTIKLPLFDDFHSFIATLRRTNARILVKDLTPLKALKR